MTESVLTKSQKRTTRKDLPGMIIEVELRFDDECGNGHNTFAITADVYEPYLQRGEPTRKHAETGKTMWLNRCGCQHKLIAKHFPELAHLIKWHLCATDGPMHYIANTTYNAGDRDHQGKRKGEPYAWSSAVRFGDNPIQHRIGSKFSSFLQAHSPEFDLEILAIEHGPDKEGYKFAPKYTFGGYADKWYECPFDTLPDALNFLQALQMCAPQFLQAPTLWSDGKERDLNAARNAAVWPEATDEELSVPSEELKAKLEARLPALLAAFRADIEALGFVW